MCSCYITGCSNLSVLHASAPRPSRLDPRMLRSVFIVCAAASSALGAWTSTPFSPPSVPLAVRSPYLSAWLPQGSGRALNDGWATFWTGSALGWAGYARVDGTVCNFVCVQARLLTCSG